MQYKYCVDDGGVAGYIASWRPSSVSPLAADFARAVVTGAAPGGQERAKSLLWAAGKLADYAIGLGLEPVPGVLLHPSVIERFAVCAPGLSGAARRTLRTNLRFLARRAVPALAPADAPLPRERSKAPYSAAEISGYLALADAQPTTARRMRAAGLVCLGAGAGLIRSDLRGARGGRGWCRSWPATTICCLPRRRSPGTGWSPAAVTRTAGTWPPRCCGPWTAGPGCPGWRPAGCGRPGWRTAPSRSGWLLLCTRRGSPAPSGSVT